MLKKGENHMEDLILGKDLGDFMDDNDAFEDEEVDITEFGFCNPLNEINPIKENIERERVEVYFKPKKKYVGAFTKLNRMFNLFAPNIIWKGTSQNNLVGAINVDTGELDLKVLLDITGYKDEPKKIKHANIDIDLKKELLEAIEYWNPADDFGLNSHCYLRNFLSAELYSVDVHHNFMKKDGTVLLYFNIADMARNENGGRLDFNPIGEILGTFAESIEEVVHVFQSEDLDTMYERIDFETSKELNQLKLINLRVPNERLINLYDNYCSSDPNLNYVDNTVRKDIKLKLVDCSKKYHVKASVKLRDEIKGSIKNLFNTIDIIQSAFDKGKLRFTLLENDKDRECLDVMKFDVLLSSFSIERYIIENLYHITLLNCNNREYVLREQLAGVKDKEVFEAIIKDDKLSILDSLSNNLHGKLINVEANRVDDNWEFEADMGYIDTDAIREFIKGVSKNVSYGDNAAKLVIEEI